MSYATSNDVSAAWRTLTDDEDAVATALVDYASVLLDRRFPTLAARVADGSLDERLARLAVVQMVRRAMENPEGAESRSEAIDDYRVTVDYGSAAHLRTMLRVTDAEVDLVSPTATRRRFGTIRVTPGMA